MLEHKESSRHLRLVPLQATVHRFCTLLRLWGVAGRQGVSCLLSQAEEGVPYLRPNPCRGFRRRPRCRRCGRCRRRWTTPPESLAPLRTRTCSEKPRRPRACTRRSLLPAPSPRCAGFMASCMSIVVVVLCESERVRRANVGYEGLTMEGREGRAEREKRRGDGTCGTCRLSAAKPRDRS